jgi:hypothetical protein
MTNAAGTWVALLLAERSPSLRWLVLRKLLGRADDDPEVQELASLREGERLVADLWALQAEDGSWKGTDLGKASAQPSGWATAHALMRLGYLGFGLAHPGVQRGAEYLFSVQREDGSWPLTGMGWPGKVDREREAEGYAMIPLQTAMPLRALAMCGYATDPRAERAYEWLLSKRLEDGAWPTGLASGNYGGVAGYRRLPHSRWGCRTNTTGALICLALHPQRKGGEEARRALDLLLAMETLERQPLGFEVARLIGVEEARGTLTYFARHDLAQALDLCWRVGASSEDERVASMVTFVRQQQGAFGLWEYTPRPQASRWVTFDILRSLSKLDKTVEWVSLEPRTAFRAYGKRPRRY